MISNAQFELSHGQIHIWMVPAKFSDDALTTFEEVLDTNEKDRAAGFRFPHLRESFVTAHGTLRYLLGRYLHSEPAGIQFAFGSKGKPMLPSPQNLKFNMSHSGDLTVMAFAADCEIGVDAEKVRPLPDVQKIADRFFCPEEASELASLPQPERQQAFFNCWTRKEAYLKAKGTGLSAPLDGCRVSIDPQTTPCFIHIDHDTAAAKAWTLHDLELAPGYAAALAYQAPKHSLIHVSVDDFHEIISPR